MKLYISFTYIYFVFDCEVLSCQNIPKYVYNLNLLRQFQSSYVLLFYISAECNVLPSVLSGSYTIKTDGKATYAEYKCDVGTTINGDVTVSCDVNGDWSSTSANISCGEFQCQY